MSNKGLEKLVNDMSTVIQAHNLGSVDPLAATVLQRADSVANHEVLIDHTAMIEAIRKANYHPYAA